MSFHDKVIYQIYPKSFNDTTGSGIGDLKGVTEKLPYLKELGVDMVWLSPFYKSPQNDNGYDVADYKSIDPIFGDFSDFDQMVEKAQELGLEIMLDMVLNHVSTDHEWFQKALAGDKKYQDFFYIEEPKADGSLPSNWPSKFGGLAWEPFGDTGKYYLHLYDVTQADLNWHNPELRKELFDVVNFWREKGVKGFRFDVLNVIGKDKNGFVDATDGVGKYLYTDTPVVHDFVRELNQATFGKDNDFITVGEMSSTTVENGLKYSNPDRGELSMIFNFHHLKVDYEDGEKWTDAPFDFIQLKKIFDEWQVGMSDGGGWNAVFFNNHDQPRANSRFGDTDNYPYETATMLAQTIHFMRGTPYIYQGEEIGMENPDFKAIEDYQDIESLNAYKELLDGGKSEEEALYLVQQKSRDNARTPVQWTSGGQAGFTSGKPWLKLADNIEKINAEDSKLSQDIFAYYQKLIKLRKAYPLIQDGSYQTIQLDHPKVYAYLRELEGQKLLVLNHFYGGQAQIDIGKDLLNHRSQCLISNSSDRELKQKMELGPYETIAFLIDTDL